MPPKVPQEQIDAALDLYLKYNGGNLAAIEREMRVLGYSNFSKQRIRKSDGKGGYTGWEIEYNWPRLLKLKEERTVEALEKFDDEKLLSLSLSILQGLQEKIHTDSAAGYQVNLILERINEIRARRPAEVDRYGNFLIFLEDLLKAANQIAPDLTKAIHAAKDPLLDWAEKKYGNNDG
jgi:hypothetical protein